MSWTKPKTNILFGLKKIVKYELFFTYLLLFLVKPNNLDWMPYLLATHYIRHSHLLWTCIVTIVIVCPCTNKNLSIDAKLRRQTWIKDNPYMALCQRKNMETLFQIIQKSKLYTCINDLRLAMLGQPSIKIYSNPNPHLYFLSPKQKIWFWRPK